MTELKIYLDNAHSPYHAVTYAKERLIEAGFHELKVNEAFALEAGRAYFTCPYDTAMFAFRMPENNISSIRIGCAHTDFPTFKIKPVADMSSGKGNVRRINIEPYGGMLKKTWFDRPLGIAGIVMVKGSSLMKPDSVLFDSILPWAYIPSLAPHMDREIEKKEVDVAKEMLPVIGLEDENKMCDLIANKMNIKVDDILSYDLNLYDVTNAEYVGVSEEFITSERIDNIASVAALTEGIINGNKLNAEHISMIALFDNEEIGSRTKQGADSNILQWIIEKICESEYVKNQGVDYKNLLLNGMMLSVDGAHAVHPNYVEKADTTTIAELGKGFVIKTSVSQRYVSDPKMLAIIKGICNENDIKYQVQANKSGTPGGQTLGPIASSYLPIPAADMGIPMLAMHSIRELAALDDYEELKKFIMTII